MKSVILSLAILVANISFSQSDLTDQNSDEVVRFESAIVDYEIYHGKPVALIKNNGEYFIYYIDSAGAGLFQSFDIFFPTEITIDPFDHLYIAGLDSAFQLSVTNHVERIAEMDISTYREKMSLSAIYFNKSVANISGSQVHFHNYYNLTDSVGELLSVHKLNTMKPVVNKRRPAVARTNNRSSLDQPLKDDLTTNMKNDIVSTPRNSNSKVFRSYEMSSPNRKAYSVNSFRKNQELWVIDEIEYRLNILDEYGTLLSSNLISPCPYKSKLFQDDTNGNIYVLTKSNGKTRVQLLEESGVLIQVAELSKGLTISEVKIFNGFIYYRDSKGKGEAIKRMRLN